MNRFLARMATASFALTLLSPAWTLGEDNTLDNAVGAEKLEAFLEGVDTLTAAFKLSLLDADLQLLEESEGTLRIKRPGRFRWDYTEPYQQLVLSDGEKLWLYDADLEQASVRELDQSLSTTPAMLLSGSGEVSDGFDIIGVYDADGVVWVNMQPKEGDTDFQTFSLGFTGDDLRYMQLSDRLDQVTQIEFSNIVRNETVDDRTFDFTPPEGVDVIGLPAKPPA